VELGGSARDLSYLRTPRAVRDRSLLLFERALRGESAHFEVHEERLDDVALYVARVAREHDVAKEIDAPRHGRMRHFDSDRKPRVAALEAKIRGLSPDERARTKIDLVLPSVLLDAGAGDEWAYVEDGVRHARTEGLAIATFELFMRGDLASDGRSLRADAEGLSRMTSEKIANAFQVTRENPLVGVEGRARTLAGLAVAMRANADVFGPDARVGHLYDALKERSVEGTVRASDVVSMLLASLSSIWPGVVSVAGEPLGDAWTHRALGEGADSVVPFHKLTQWLTYSLVEPLAEGGIRVEGLSDLTGLAEYRNGGLFLDLGVLSLRDAHAANRTFTCGDELVVEWRALTVSLLDRLAPRAWSLVGRCSADLTPGVVEALTWTAGRQIAYEKREHGAAPLRLERDGTVF